MAIADHIKRLEKALNLKHEADMSCRYRTFNVLEDSSLREGIKEYSAW